MIKFNNWLLCIALFLLGKNQPLQAQESLAVLSYADYMQMVMAQHPVARQAKLLSQRATAELKRAKGANLDPVLNAQWDTKQFDEKQYYNLFSAYISVPTYWGIEIEGGYLSNKGYYLNPENKTPTDGHAYLGVKVPLLQGLITNERRLAIEQASLLQGQNEQQLRLALNELLYKSAQEYWEWAAAYQELELWQNALKLSQSRFDATKAAYLAGDKPAVDTLEAFSVILDRQIKIQEAEYNLLEAQLSLSNYLWSLEQTPMILLPQAKPDELPNKVILDQSKYEERLASIATQHPDLQLYQIQLKSLELERKVKRNKLMPKLEFKYNFLAYNGVNFFPSGIDAFGEQYKMGLKFSMPLLLRQASADIELNKIKIEETNYKLQQKQLEIRNKLTTYYALMQTYQSQLQLVEQNLDNYRRLLTIEQQKFQMGESSMFLVNSRETKLIEAEQKKIAMLGKIAKAQASLAWASAALGIQE